MIVSLNALKKLVEIDISVDELVALIGARLVEIEEIIDLGAKYKGIYVAKVVEAKPLEGSDHLSLVKIDDGGVAKDAERDEKGLVHVVCGAPNVRNGIFVAWLAPGSIVPDTYGTDKPFEIGSRELCGAKSNGMIASARELALYDEHDGILELGTDQKPGVEFAKAYELDDYLLDIENKSLTHRPDCFGLIGFAREIAAITNKAFKTPGPYNQTELKFGTPDRDDLEISVQIDDPELSARYQAVVMKNINNTGKSILASQIFLSKMGVRPINPIVDNTNVTMLLAGQPMHAFDYDKLLKVSGGRTDIHVRAGRAGEKLSLLDGRTIELTSEDIVIAAGESAIALAGAMGGNETEVDENTKNIVLESATFNLYNLRATQMRHGIFSEAITRFTKGQSPAQTEPALLSTARSLCMDIWGNGEYASGVKEDYPGKITQDTIEINIGNLNDFLGSTYSEKQVIDTLQNVEFSVEKSGDILKITPPYWRADIHIPEDIIEEIGRINGFDNIEPTLPTRDFTAVKPNDFDEFRSKIRKLLVRAGANEMLTYNFIHGDLMKKTGLNTDDSYRIVNSISPDLQYYRQTLLPSLLNLIYPNIKQGFDEFALFEVNKVHIKSRGLTNEKVPVEFESMALVIASKDQKSGAPYYQTKRYFEYLIDVFGLKVEYRPIQEDITEPSLYPFEYKRAAAIFDKESGMCFGVVGDFKKQVSKAFKLPDYSSGFELNLKNLFDAASKKSVEYKPLSRFPSSERDVCFKVEAAKSYAELINSANDALNGINLEIIISPIDIYRAEDSDTKNITLRIKLTSYDHTLTGQEVTDTVNRISSFIKIQTGAEII